MGASRLKPLTVKEVEKLTATLPTTIKHRSLGGVPGFVLVHTPAGHTSYGLNYRANGERKKLTLGNAKRLTLGNARKLAGQFRSNIEAGGDPHGEKLNQRRLEIEQRRQDATKEGLDAERMWEKYMRLVASQLRTRGEKDRIFRKYILPTVRGLCVTEITKTHALAAIDTLVDQGKRPMADKVRQEGAAFFEWLIERDHVERNVFARIRKTKNANSIRTRVLSDDEVGAIWLASEVEGHWSCWIKLLILTGGRNMEVRGARWSEFNFETRLWTIPAERYKNGYSHTVYLTDAMLEVLDAVPRYAGIDMLFPAAGNPTRPMSGDQKVKGRIDRRMRETWRQTNDKEPENWCVHDFRRTIATGLQRLGFRPDIADQVIGHVGSTRKGAGAHYLHHRYDDERKEALNTWSDHMTKICAIARMPNMPPRTPLPTGPSV
ncbi:tyrosine-type recombinase/integrase [Sphingomonas sp. RB3P16]|uniref:tyrosine-type recombinase/integrase n=1 Tax=Parasphingomonas frigoris TaxID=3096163 RepID=UPI002FC74C73